MKSQKFIFAFVSLAFGDESILKEVAVANVEEVTAYVLL